MSDASKTLRAARESAGLTQAELAARLGVTQSAIAKLESDRANPSVATLDRALRATGHRLQLLAPAWGTGPDVSLLRAELTRSPVERLRSFERLYSDGRRLARAGARARGELA